jgi:tetratricopeptide (TPR) repeat protein
MLALAPDAAPVHLNFGVVLEESGRLPEAISHYRRALELDPDLPEAAVTLSSALLNQSDHTAEVIALCEALVNPVPGGGATPRHQLSPAGAAAAHNNLCLAFLGRGQIEEAMAHCQRALEIKPEYADARANLGLVLAAQGKPDEAIAAYRQALAIRPDHVNAHNNLAGRGFGRVRPHRGSGLALPARAGTQTRQRRSA